jgi:two-component system response regulator DesR
MSEEALHGPTALVCDLLEALLAHGGWIRTGDLAERVGAQRDNVRRALQAGVDGFLLKDSPATELLAAIDKVMAGGKVIAPELAMLALGQDNPLHDKERRALRLSSEGKSTSDIAALLFLAEGTVRNYLSDAINKLNAANRFDAARIARQRGWL